jgi:hypothetical protein
VRQVQEFDDFPAEIREIVGDFETDAQAGFQKKRGG